MNLNNNNNNLLHHNNNNNNNNQNNVLSNMRNYFNSVSILQRPHWVLNYPKFLNPLSLDFLFSNNGISISNFNLNNLNS